MLEELNREDLKQLKRTLTKGINKAESKEQLTFIYKGEEILVSYAKHLITYINTKL